MKWEEEEASPLCIPPSSVVRREQQGEERTRESFHLCLKKSVPCYYHKERTFFHRNTLSAFYFRGAPLSISRIGGSTKEKRPSFFAHAPFLFMRLRRCRSFAGGRGETQSGEEKEEKLTGRSGE